MRIGSPLSEGWPSYLSLDTNFALSVRICSSVQSSGSLMIQLLRPEMSHGFGRMPKSSGHGVVTTGGFQVVGGIVGAVPSHGLGEVVVVGLAAVTILIHGAGVVVSVVSVVVFSTTGVAAVVCAHGIVVVGVVGIAGENNVGPKFFFAQGAGSKAVPAPLQGSMLPVAKGLLSDGALKGRPFSSDESFACNLTSSSSTFKGALFVRAARPVPSNNL
mmetsp:Transcript_68287/g.120556  ORF Transcript_68287/g.120556 Transcript_68287/m.120556 type:complete len:216 (+) Transcript_68287:2301-2948(+)